MAESTATESPAHRKPSALSSILHLFSYGTPVTGDPAEMSEDKLKTYARQGFANEEHRLRGYKAILKIDQDDAMSRRAKAFYHRAIKDVFNDEPTNVVIQLKQIPTFGSHREWASGLTASETNSVGRILCILRELADVQGGPLIPSVTRLLLEHVEEHEAYAILTAMVKDKRERYFTTNIEEDTCRILAFKELLPIKTTPELSSHILSMAAELTDDIITQWFHTLFSGWISKTHTTRVLDSFVVERYKIIFRFGLGLLRLHGPLLLACRTEREMWEALRRSSMSPKFDFNALCVESFTALNLKQVEIDAAVDAVRLRRSAERKLAEATGFGRIKSTTPVHSSMLLVGARICRMLGDHKRMITPAQLRVIVPYLPERLQLRDLRLSYTSDKDGWDVERIYTCGGSLGPSLLLIEIRGENTIIGCFASHAWKIHPAPFGNKHCFVFRCKKAASSARGSRSSLSSTKSLASAETMSPRVEDELDVYVAQETSAVGEESGSQAGSVRDEDEEAIELKPGQFAGVSRTILFDAGSIGLSFETARDGTGAVVKAIDPIGQAAALDSELKIGDVLISYCGTSTIGMDYGQLVNAIRSTTEVAGREIVFVPSVSYYETLEKSKKASLAPGVPEFHLDDDASGLASGLVDDASGKDEGVSSDEDDGEPIHRGVIEGLAIGSDGLAYTVIDEMPPEPGLSSAFVGSASVSPVPGLAPVPASPAIGMTPLWSAMPSDAFAQQRRHLYMMAQKNFMLIGGTKGHSRAAIKLNKDLMTGSTDSTDTFLNPILTYSGSRDFEVERVELFTFVMPPVSAVATAAMEAMDGEPVSRRSFDVRKTSEDNSRSLRVAAAATAATRRVLPDWK